MVTEARDAKLADFGLAKRLGSPQADGGCLCGTPNFMAPELFAGQAATTHSDIYAMGVTYHCLLRGRLPIATQSLNELIQFHRAGTVLELNRENDELPTTVHEVLSRCLDRDAASRFEHALELHNALRAAYGGLRSLQSLLMEAFVTESISLVEREGRFELVVPLAGGRRQTVYVEIVRDADSQAEIVRVFSRCSPSSADYHERALSHGSIGIEAFEEQPYFVMLNAYPRSTCDPEEIRASVLTIAQHADELERLLTGADRH
jgi:serine/threonine-protein kinase